MRNKLSLLTVGSIVSIAATIYVLAKAGSKRTENDNRTSWTKEASVTIKRRGNQYLIDTPTPRFNEPMFEVGDEVLIYNPYEDGYYAQFDNISPTVYEISDVRFDDKEGVYRYRLVNDPLIDMYGKWISEDWLSLPLHTTFTRDLGEKTSEYNHANPTPEMIEAERKIIEKVLDDQAYKGTVDMLLDKLNGGNAEERSEAMRKLSELTTKEETE
ncbi:hypothetical protein [Virgibacillus proomii]|uniref:hypothetical protein n=1 Tax=Virgibacillus proomii TaxID=84407 RepID=UPI001C1293F7|nr:hypothetical protein [Virgibacillus proomii]MBU5266236.1 hypothetical protein [Virgibacillus proomii]